MQTEIHGLMEMLNLGTPVEEPAGVKGGLLHRMFRVATSKGIFAVKLLNPEIMKRPAALQNTVNSEKIAAAFSSLVPVVSALERNGEQVHKWGDNYYLVYPWIEGRSVFPGEIRADHCRIIGEILGKMHRRNLKMEGICPETDSFAIFPWEDYARQIREEEQRIKAGTGAAAGDGRVCGKEAAEDCNREYAAGSGTDRSEENSRKGVGGCGGEWMDIYMEALSDIRRWNEDACGAGEYLSEVAVISHRDLDPKNVMWKEGLPVICAGVIDWEAAGYVNPFQEFLEVIHYWADDGKGGLVPENLEALIRGYGRYMDMEAVEWELVYKGSCMGMLGWLEYNVKRALGKEASDRAEICLGREQAVRTVKELHAYQEKMTQVLNRIKCTVLRA